MYFINLAVTSDKMIIFIIVLFKVNAELLPLTNDYFQKHSLSQCVISALDQFIDYGEVISVIVSSTNPSKSSTVPFDAILFKDISVKNDASYVIKKVETRKLFEEYRKPITAYLIHIREPKELISSITFLSEESSWNPHAYFFVVSTYPAINTDAILHELFSEIWLHYRILNLVILLPKNFEGWYSVYTGFPSGICATSAKFYKIDRCVSGDFKNKDWFPDKVPTDLNGCQINVRTRIIEPFVIRIRNGTQYYFDGFEIKLLNAIAEHSNFTVNYSLPIPSNSYGIILRNGTLTGSLSDLKNKEIDMILGYFIAWPGLQPFFDIVTPHISDSLVFCVKRAKPFQNLVSMTQYLDKTVLFLLIMICFVISCLIYSTERIESEGIIIYTEYREILTNVFKIMIGVNVALLPETHTSRFLLLIWILSSNWFQTFYTVILMKSLSTPHPGHQISTEAEILEYKQTLEYFSLCKHFLNASIFDRLTSVKCDNYLDCLNKTALNEEYATCMPKLNVQYLLHHFLDEDGYTKLYYFENHIVTYPIEILLWKGHPLKPRINKLVNRLKSGGFISKWKQDVFHDLLRELNVQHFIPSDKVVLRLSHFGISLILLLTMHIISFVVFLSECFIYQWKNSVILT